MKKIATIIACLIIQCLLISANAQSYTPAKENLEARQTVPG